MKILDIKVLRGPNYWSTYRKQLIDMKLDLQESEEYPTDKIDGFADRLEDLMPSLYEHRCSENKPGGFFQRVRKGTWMGHVVEHIALELQTLAGMPCGFGRTRSTNKKGVYHVVFAYQLENAGIYAAKAAVNIVRALESDVPYDLANDIKELTAINKNEGLGPSSLSLINEARRRNIPFKRLNKDSLIMFGQGKNQKIVCATVACTSSSIGIELASDKEQTRQMLATNFIPIPQGTVVSSQECLLDAINKIGYPLVIKPVNGNHGKGVKINISTEEQAMKAYQDAKNYSDEVIVEKFIHGHDFRFLVIDYKLQAVARRTPAVITGDDKSTIEELINQTNADPRRGDGHEQALTKIKVDTVTNSILIEKNLTMNSILPFGEILFLKDAANLSAGGTAADVTDIVHPANIFLVERVARLMNLDICGIDVIAGDITSPIEKSNGAVIEVNAGPGFRMHLSPTKGTARNVAEPVLKMLFPGASNGRIPVVAVTGTNGKTTTTRLIAYIAKNAGHSVGYTTTDGIYIDDRNIFQGDCSGPVSAEAVLRDPIVDFAVLECARGGILRSGLAFDQCDISVITNVTADHLGLNDIDTIEEMAEVKSVVARSTAKDGWAVLNADDDLVYAMKNELDCNIALFSTQENNERVQLHCEEGRLAVIIEKGYFTLCKGQWRMRVARVKDVPLTLNGRATCMIKNILPAILVSAIREIDIRQLRKALYSFVPGPEYTPGRMNIFSFKNCDVLLDYAHNPDGMLQLYEFMQATNCPEKIGIIACAGDRRDEDIEQIGAIAAKTFDKIIIRHDEDGRGRTNENMSRLYIKGIRSINPDIEVKIISDEIDAICYAITWAKKGALIACCSEKTKTSIDFLLEAQKQEAKMIREHFIYEQ
jgi:cyanophycin synthetase